MAITYAELAKSAVFTLPSYVPGRPIEELARESGLKPDAIIKLASNENPLGPSPEAVRAASQALNGAHAYPEDNCFLLKQRLAEFLQLMPEQIIIGHGSSEIISLLGQTLVEPGIEVVMGQHAFICYKRAALLNGGTPIEVPLVNFCHDLPAMAAAITKHTRLVFLPSPNNPTAGGNPAANILRFAEELPEHVVLCFDGAYQEYMADPPDLRPLIAAGKKIIVLRTFSKIYGLAALRIGYAYGTPEWIALLSRVRPPFNVNGIALAAALAALDDRAFIDRSRAVNQAGRTKLASGLSKLGIATVMSEGNFLLAHFADARAVHDFLQAHGVIVRPLTGYGLPEYLRISIGTAGQNQRLLDTLAAALEAQSRGRR